MLVSISFNENEAIRDNTVYTACRSQEKAEQAITELKKLSKNENIHYLRLDLNDLDSVDGMTRFALRN